MDRFKDTLIDDATCEHHQLPAIRSFKEIARILTQREDTEIRPTDVGRICHDAERKLGRALWDEPAIGRWLASPRFKGAVVSCEAGGNGVRLSRVPARYSCVFQMRDASAHQVKLVIERPFRTPRIFSLRSRDGAVWETALWLLPGRYRYCYYAYDGRSLTQVVPADAPLDDLKAALHVRPLSRLILDIVQLYVPMK